MGAGGALAAFTEAQTLQAKREKAAGPCRNLCVKRAAVAHGNNSSFQPCFARRCISAPCEKLEITCRELVATEPRNFDTGIVFPRNQFPAATLLLAFRAP